MKKIPFIMLAAMLVMLLIPAAISATNGGTNYGFIPNCGEASISKVDLTTGVAVARYLTAPRLGDDGNTVPPYAWRTSRIDMDADGNAWVLNVGSDAYLSCYPTVLPDYASVYDDYVPAEGLLGSVVRIEGDVEAAGLTPGVDTSNYHGAPMAFDTDEAVQVFPVGDVGDMPRAIAIDADGDIWIGFYGGKYFQEYSYDGTSLSEASDRVEGNFSPYQAAIDKDGGLWFSSRNSNPTVATDKGIYYFNTDSPAAPTLITLPGTPTPNPYSILIDNSGDDVVVWATAYSGSLYKIDTAGSPPYSATEITITGASQLRGMCFDGTGKIWIVNTSDDTVCWYDPNDGTSGESGVIASDATPVGIGMDAAGYVWTVCRNDNVLDPPDPGFIAKFDPMNITGGFTTPPTYVGYRPYAYDELTTSPEGRICGYKYLGAEGEEGIEGWTIYLYGEPLDPGATPDITSADAWTTTGADGNFCFEGLAVPGTYYLCEEQRECNWKQIFDVGVGPPEFYEIGLTVEDPDSLGNIFRNTLISHSRWIGGGTISTGATIPDGVRVTHGFELHCDLDKPNNLEVNWSGNQFHLEQLLSADCFVDPTLPEPNMPRAPHNTIIAHGVGRYNRTSGYTIDFKFTDVGEPGKKDFASINVTAPDGIEVVLQVSGDLKNGNQQAHFDNK